MELVILEAAWVGNRSGQLQNYSKIVGGSINMVGYGVYIVGKTCNALGVLNNKSEKNLNDYFEVINYGCESAEGYFSAHKGFRDARQGMKNLKTK